MVVASFVEEENTTTRVSVCPDMHCGDQVTRKIRAKRNFPLTIISLFPEEGVGGGRQGIEIKKIYQIKCLHNKGRYFTVSS
jgi:hypothetical protein